MVRRARHEVEAEGRRVLRDVRRASLWTNEAPLNVLEQMLPLVKFAVATDFVVQPY